MSLILSGTDGLSDIDGSAATPAIRGTDANTGIFFPAADTIAFSEGGAEAMRITSTSDVGIGETAPASYGKLTVTGSSAADGINTWVRNTSDAAGDNVKYAGIQFSIGSDNGSAAIRAYRTNSANNLETALAFFTKDNSAGGTTPTERARIDSSGNFQMNSGYGSVATAYGCRAWVNFNGTGTPAIRASGNVSSLTDNGTGNYTVNLTTAMPDANFCVCASGGDPGTRDGGVMAPASQALTTSTVRVRGFASNALDTPYDLSVVSVAIFR